MKKAKWLCTAAAVLALSAAVAGCGGSKDEAKAQPEKVLRVATEPTFAPFEFQIGRAHV